MQETYLIMKMLPIRKPGIVGLKDQEQTSLE